MLQFFFLYFNVLCDQCTTLNLSAKWLELTILIEIIKHDIYFTMIYDVLRAVLVLIYTVSFGLSVLLFFKKREFFWISIYVLTSAISDIWIWFIPEGTYNHYAFATGMLATGLVLLVYFARTISTRRAYILYTLCFGVIITTYLQHEMWQHSTVLPEHYVAGYYTIMAAAAAYFIWQVIVLEKTKLASKPLRFGAIFMVFYTLFMLCHSFTFGYLLPTELTKYLYIILFSLNMFFELSKFTLFIFLFYKIKRT